MLTIQPCDFFSAGKREVRHVVVMQKIALQGGQVFFGAAVFEADTVIGTGVVDENIEPAKLAKCLLDRGGTIFRELQINADLPTGFARRLQFRLQLFPGLGIAVHEDRDSALARAGPSDCRADTFGAAGDQDNFFVDLQVHAEPP